MLDTKTLLEMLDLDFIIVLEDDKYYKTGCGDYFHDQKFAERAYSTQIAIETIEEDALLESLVELYKENKYKINKLQSENLSLKNYMKFFIDEKYLGGDI